MQKLALLLADGGAALLVFPTQEQFNYDVCFIDHLFHMRLAHLNYLALKCGLSVVKQEVGYQSYQLANAVVLQKATEKILSTAHLTWLDNDNPRLMVDIFRHFTETIKELSGRKRILAFGYGELCKVFAAYAEGFNCIEHFIDDYYRGNDSHVTGLKTALESGILQQSCVVFLANPSYREYIVGKLHVTGGPSHVYFPISKEIIAL